MATSHSELVSDKSFVMMPDGKIAPKIPRRGTSGLLLQRSTEPHPAFFYIECVCNAWFSLELIVRLAVAPSRWTFIRTPINMIELIASASFYLDCLMTYLKRDSDVLEFFR
jgi:potassium voltage-gated channel Shaw-related subfamily C protein 1